MTRRFCGIPLTLLAFLGIVFVLRATQAQNGERTQTEESIAGQIRRIGGIVDIDDSGKISGAFIHVGGRSLLVQGGVSGADEKDLESIPFDKLTHLKSLTVRGYSLTNDGIRHLCKCSSSLRYLSISSRHVDDRALCKLLEKQPRLVDLSLSGTGTTDRTLAEIGKLSNLKGLYLNNTKITDAGLKELQGHRGLYNLFLSKTEITDVGMKQLAKMSNLKILDISHTKVTNAGALALTSLSDLVVLSVTGTRITEDAKTTLRRVLPNLDILSEEDNPPAK